MRNAAFYSACFMALAMVSGGSACRPGETDCGPAPTPGWEECCPHDYPVCCGVNKCCVRTAAPFAMKERLIKKKGQSLAAAVQEADVGKDMTITLVCMQGETHCGPAPTPGCEECCPHDYPVCCGVKQCCVSTPAPFAMTERLIKKKGQSLAAAVQEADVGKDKTITLGCMQGETDCGPAPTPGYEECCPHDHPVCCGVNQCCVRTAAPFAMTERLIKKMGQSLAAAVQETDVGKDMTITV